MRPIDLEIEGFLSVGTPIKIDFRNRGLVFVIGDNKDKKAYFRRNGAGKTAIFCDAITWVLTGKLANWPVSAIPNVAYGGPVKVQFRFVIHEKKVIVTRYRNHPKHKNNVFLNVNGVELTGLKDSITNTEILKVLGINDIDILYYTTIFGQGLSNRFSSLTPQLRAELVENLIGVKYFDDSRREARSRALLRQKEIDNLSLSISEVKSQLATATRERDRFRESMRKKGEEVGDKLDALNTKLEEELGKMEGLKKEEKRINDKLNAVRNAFNTLEFKLRTLEREKVVFDKWTGKCPQCGQSVPNSNPPKDPSDELAKGKAEFIKVKKYKVSLDESRSKLDTSIRKVSSAIGALNGEIKAIYRHKEDMSKLAKRTEDQFKVEEIQARLDELNEKLDNHLGKIKYHQYWVDGFQSARSMIFQGTLASLQKKVDHYLAKLCGDTITVHLSARKTTQKGTVKQEIDVQINVKGNLRSSSGEKDRADVAIALGLHDLAIETSQLKPTFMVIDEPIVHVDEPGIRRFVDILKGGIPGVESVFLIAHNPIFEPLCDEKLLVVKEGGMSRLESIR